MSFLMGPMFICIRISTGNPADNMYNTAVKHSIFCTYYFSLNDSKPENSFENRGLNQSYTFKGQGFILIFVVGGRNTSISIPTSFTVCSIVWHLTQYSRFSLSLVST